MTDIVQIQESEYNAILRQTVAVIDRTKKRLKTIRRNTIWSVYEVLHETLQNTVGTIKPSSKNDLILCTTY